MKCQNLTHFLNNHAIHWKKQLAQFEHNRQWDEAIEFMRKVIAQYPDNLDAYLSINYLIMNLLVEEDDYDQSKHYYYAALLKRYFDESYTKFSENPEYLFFIGKIAVMSEWYFGIEQEEIKQLLDKALILDPNNILYQWTYYMFLDKKDPKSKELRKAYANSIIKNESIKKLLLSKGSLGKYILELLVYWATEMVKL